MKIATTLLLFAFAIALGCKLDEQSQSKALTISVGGEVRKPGVYPYNELLTLEQAIALAGGFTDHAVGIEIKRQGTNIVRDGFERELFELKSKIPIKYLKFPILPFDTVIALHHDFDGF